MTQVNSYLAEFSRKSNLSPVYKHKVIKSLRQEIEAKIEGGDTEKDVISSFGPVSLLAQNMDNELYSQTCIMPKMSRLIFVALLFVYKTEPAASTALPAPNICCCKWWTNITLQGWSGKLKLYAGKPHIHSCWWLSKWRIGTMICRRGLRRPSGASRVLLAGQEIRLHGWSRLCRASVGSIL